MIISPPKHTRRIVSMRLRQKAERRPVPVEETASSIKAKASPAPLMGRTGGPGGAAPPAAVAALATQQERL